MGENKMRLSEVSSNTDIERLLILYEIKNYTIRADGLVDVNGDVNLSKKDFNKLPIRFGKVTGDFSCCECTNLTSLEGAPEECNNFFCHLCDLRSLKYSPKKVNKDFYCYDNLKLKTLEGSPEYVEGDFDCSFNNSLTSLSFLPKHIGGYLIAAEIPLVKNYLVIFKSKHIGGIELQFDNDTKIQDIINKYLPTKDIIGCQDELIEAGLEEYARTK
jgi:hypothetical protein